MKFRSDALHLLILLPFTPLLACAGGPGGTKAVSYTHLTLPTSDLV